MKPLRTALLTLSLSAASLGGVACQSPLTDEESLVGEASAAVTIAEETGDVTADAVALESSSDLSTSADLSAELPPATTESDGVCDFSAQRQRIMARYDANGDGKLSLAERQALRGDLEDATRHPVAVRFALAHRGHVMQRLRWVFDENNDGVLSTEERTALVDALEARCERIHATVMERFDANGDGTLDATERQAVKDALVARLRAARQAILEKYDTNGNGVLDHGERVALREDRVAAFQARKAELIDAYDVNDDGTLDDAEKLALKQAIQRRIIEGRDAE